MALIDYVSQTSSAVSVTYAEMPAAAEIVFVNSTSGAKTPSGTVLAQGGAGSADVSIASSLTSGRYYLLAQSQETKGYIAQTVDFYIDRRPRGWWGRLLNLIGIPSR